MSREVENSGLQMTAEGIPFDIATKGTAVRNESLLDSVKYEVADGVSRPEYSSGTASTLLNTSNVSGTYYVADKLKLRFTPAADDPNTVDDESIPPDIGPDSNGELSLYVIPKVDTALNIKVSLNVIAFAEVNKMSNGEIIYKKYTEGEHIGQYILDSLGNKIPETEIIEITNAASFASAATTKTGNTDAASHAADYVEAADYLRGHILFFGGQGDPNNAAAASRYQFSVPYTVRSDDKQIVFNYPVPQNNKGRSVNIPIFWMWSNTLGQIALKNGDTTSINGIPAVRNMTSEQISAIPNNPLTDKEKMIKYVKDNKDYILANWRSITLSTDESTQLETLTASIQSNSSGSLTAEQAAETAKSQMVDSMIDNLDNTNNFSRLSKCYNVADNDIGTRVAYFMIDVTVESVQ